MHCSAFPKLHTGLGKQSPFDFKPAANAWTSMNEECPGLLAPKRSIIGLCTGLLAASAVSSAASPSSLIPLAVETVKIAFRLGLHIDSVADRLRVRGHDEECWSVLVSGVTEIVAKCAVDDFNEEQVTICPLRFTVECLIRPGKLGTQSCLHQRRKSIWRHC
jgi:hypothetical protein